MSTLVVGVPHGAGVGDRYRDLAAVDHRANAHDPTLRHIGDAVLDGVFDESLNEHRRNAGVERSGIQRALEAQAIFEARALE